MVARPPRHVDPLTAGAAADLLVRICHCSDVVKALGDSEHPCRGVIDAQPDRRPEKRQVPEPWSGHLESAPILFVSSNPSISGTEVFPTGAWIDDEVRDFFSGRFEAGPGGAPWIKEGIRTRQPGDPATYSGWVRFLAGVRRRAAEIKGSPPQPGIDYCLTEVVHCKSRTEEWAVPRAAGYCSARWLDEILAASGARIVVALGSLAGDALRDRVGSSEGPLVRAPLGARERLVLYLPHPNARGPRKSISAALTPEQILDLREEYTGPGARTNEGVADDQSGSPTVHPGVEDLSAP